MIIVGSVFLIAAVVLMVLIGSSKALNLPFLSDMKRSTVGILIVLGLFIMSFSYINPFVYNNSGYRTFAETITGKQKVVFKPGLSFIGPIITDTEVYPNVITTSFSKEEVEQITFKGSPFEIRFNDATKAMAEATVRWELPDDDPQMINIHRKYGSATKLAQTTLSEYSKACLRYAAQLMESETHYSGGQSRLQEDFRSQLQEGQYVLEMKTEYVIDTLTNESQKLTTAFLRTDDNGVPIRIKSDIHQYNINVDYAQVGEVDYEKQVDEKLAQKIESSTRESISKQKLITAQQEALTAKEEGKKLIEETRARELASKEEAVIQAQKDMEVAKERATEAKYVAERIEQEGRANAAANEALVKAGLTPLERANIDKDIAIGVAQALAGPQGIKFPELLIIGGENGNTLDPFDAVGLESFMQISKQIKNNATTR